MVIVRWNNIYKCFFNCIQLLLPWPSSTVFLCFSSLIPLLSYLLLSVTIPSPPPTTLSSFLICSSLFITISFLTFFPSVSPSSIFLSITIPFFCLSLFSAYFLLPYLPFNSWCSDLFLKTSINYLLHTGTEWPMNLRHLFIIFTLTSFPVTNVIWTPVWFSPLTELCVPEAQ